MVHLPLQTLPVGRTIVTTHQLSEAAFVFFIITVGTVLSDPVQTITADELVNEFELFFDWEERYQYLIEMGTSLPALENSFKTDATRVQGCLSTVWLVAAPSPSDSSRLVFNADSDSQLVKGLVYILIRLYNNKTAAEIVEVNINDIFERLQLRQHISRSRSNGLNSMISRIRTLAVEHAAVTKS